MRRVERHVRGDGSVRYTVRFRGPRKTMAGIGETSETFDTKREAERFARLLEDLGVQGALDQLYEDEQVRLMPTLTEVAASHIETLTGITEGTRLSYSRLWARTWAPLIGTLPANRVAPDDVRRAVNSLGRRYSRKSLENQRGLLAAVLTRCVEGGYLPTNPAKGIRLPREREVDRTEMRIITPDEFSELVEHVPEHYRPLVRFLAGTGCRWGEAVALQVGDVAMPNVRIRRALKWSPDNHREVGPTKTRRSNRTVALPTELRDEIRALCTDRPRDALVFTAQRGGPVLHRTFWSRVWMPAVEQLEPPRPRIHDLRHSHAAWLLAAGVPIHIVQARLGHESIKTTVDTYGGLMPDAQMAAAQAASLVFSERPAIEG